MLHEKSRQINRRSYRRAYPKPAQHLTLRLVGVAAILLTSLMILSSCAGKLYEVVGGEMEPTFREGQTITAVPVAPDEVERGDPVIYRLPNGDIHLKRVVGLPGETIRISRGHVIVDDTQLAEPYATGIADDERLVPEQLAGDEFYILSDNRADGYDSRHHGPVAADQIIARAEVTWLSRLAQQGPPR